MNHTRASKVGQKGQIVIAKEIRDQLGIQPGSEAVQRVVNGHVELEFAPPRHNRSLRGILAPYAKRSIGPTDEDWRRAREEAWEARVQDIMDLHEDDC